jgi:farnesyl-diphosphate farnesyltransferase
MLERISTLKLSPTEITYLETWMNKVSRSFAVVVSSLEEPMRSYLAGAYLICRIIDNVEDCKAESLWKRERFEEVARLLHQPAMAKTILPTWDGEVWPGLSAAQRQIMTLADGYPLWQIYSQFPAEVKNIITRWSLQMIAGMSGLEEPDSPPKFVTWNEIQVLANENDYDQYCYIVAGTVGHMATELVIVNYGLNGTTAQKMLQYSEACGRSLQKTNIVKDFKEDLDRNICYLPDEWLNEVRYSPLRLQGATPEWCRKVLMNVLCELQDACDYVLAVPYNVASYRMASLLCLLPAYQTILLTARQSDHLFTPEHPQKISHEVFSQCVLDAQTMVTNNAAVSEYALELTRAVEAQFVGL